MKRLAVSVGCPSGIGPEVSIVAARKLRGACVLLVGDHGAIERAARGRGAAKPSRVESPEGARGEGVFAWQPGKALDERDRVLGAPTKGAGRAQLAWIDAACDLVSGGGFDALVTGPVSKAAVGFLGHTEHLMKRLRAREVVMAFWSEGLSTALVTTHLPLSKVPRAITEAGVSRAAFWLCSFLAKLSGGAPRVAIAALNPHAGEGGLLGNEERRISRGIARARQRLARAHVDAVLTGPVPAETAMRLGAAGDYDGVVAMYHDQATIPMKLLAFGDEVNVSLGLPIIRTSVDHGTAYDRAPRFDANASGMLAAMKLAVRLAT
jgi:4-hydroxythreonine-4-phosphate dehydrogenase